MLAYHDDTGIKAKYIARVRAHRVADQLVQGTGWEDGRGCAVGCTLESYEHARYPIELGIPLHLAYLEDALFELLPVQDAQLWPERFLSAIRPGADLSGVWPAWAVWMLTDPTHGVIRHCAGFPDCEAAVLRVAELWRNDGPPKQFAAAAATSATAAGAAEVAAAAAWAVDGPGGGGRDRDRGGIPRAAWAAEAARAASYAAGDAADAAEAARAASYAAGDVADAAARSQAACDRLIALLESA